MRVVPSILFSLFQGKTSGFIAAKGRRQPPIVRSPVPVHVKNYLPTTGERCPCWAWKWCDYVYQRLTTAEKRHWQCALKRRGMSRYDLFMKESIALVISGQNTPDVPSPSGGYSAALATPGTAHPLPAEAIGRYTPPPPVHHAAVEDNFNRPGTRFYGSYPSWPQPPIAPWSSWNWFSYIPRGDENYEGYEPYITGQALVSVVFTHPVPPDQMALINNEELDQTIDLSLPLVIQAKTMWHSPTPPHYHADAWWSIGADLYVYGSKFDRIAATRFGAQQAELLIVHSDAQGERQVWSNAPADDWQTLSLRLHHSDGPLVAELTDGNIVTMPYQLPPDPAPWFLRPWIQVYVQGSSPPELSIYLDDYACWSPWTPPVP